METATHYTGNLRIRTRINGDDTFSAWIYVDGQPSRVARLDDLRLARAWSGAIDSREAHAEMASSAVSFEAAGLWSPSEVPSDDPRYDVRDVEAYERESKVEAADGYPDSDDHGETVVFQSTDALELWWATNYAA